MQTKILFLTIFFTIGFTFYNCAPDCDCPPSKPFFDIKGFDLETNNCNENASPTAATPFEDVCSSLRFDINYISYQAPPSWNFSLMNSAMACTCIQNGWEGAKTEKLDELTIITLNDFDDDHLKNDTINDLLLVEDGLFRLNKVPVDAFLAQDTTNLKFEYLNLLFTLRKAPELDPMYHYKIIVGLSNGERYEQESVPILVE